MDNWNPSDNGHAGRVTGHFHDSRARAQQPPKNSARGSAMTTGKNHNEYFEALERAKRWERNVLGCLLEAPTENRPTDLTADDFPALKDHREIFRAMVKLEDLGITADIHSVEAELDASVDRAYFGCLIQGVMPENFKGSVAQLRQANRNCRFLKLRGELDQATDRDDQIRLLDQLQEVLRGPVADQILFHSAEEFENAPPACFAIENFLQESGITMVGGLSGHGKTLIMMAMAQALLDGTPLFDHEFFAVPAPAERVIYLIPECAISPFWARIKLFRMQEHVRAGRLLVRTLSSREQVSLDDPRLLKAAKGAHVFLDTAVRFMNGSENDVEATRPFAEILFRLLGAGARTITGAHHSRKPPDGGFAREVLTLENTLRGSTDLGAMLCTAWGVRQVDVDKNQLYVQNVKPRDFQPCGAFLLEGRPHLDETGQFKMLKAPGEAGELRSYLRKDDDDGSRNRGRPVTADKADKVRQAVELRAQGLSIREIAKTVGVGKSTVEGWLFEQDSSQAPPLPMEGVR
jgi:AAA domain/Helix-turn-helix domain of resolvase/DnaB-like helicase N terminal domain